MNFFKYCLPQASPERNRSPAPASHNLSQTSPHHYVNQIPPSLSEQKLCIVTPTKPYYISQEEKKTYIENFVKAFKEKRFLLPKAYDDDPTMLNKLKKLEELLENCTSNLDNADYEIKVYPPFGGIALIIKEKDFEDHCYIYGSYGPEQPRSFYLISTSDKPVKSIDKDTYQKFTTTMLRSGATSILYTDQGDVAKKIIYRNNKYFLSDDPAEQLKQFKILDEIFNNKYIIPAMPIFNIEEKTTLSKSLMRYLPKPTQNKAGWVSMSDFINPTNGFNKPLNESEIAVIKDFLVNIIGLTLEIQHNDIKPENIMIKLCKDGTIEKLCLIDVESFFSGNPNAKGGTPIYNSSLFSNEKDDPNLLYHNLWQIFATCTEFLLPYSNTQTAETFIIQCLKLYLDANLDLPKLGANINYDTSLSTLISRINDLLTEINGDDLNIDAATQELQTEISNLNKRLSKELEIKLRWMYNATISCNQHISARDQLLASLNSVIAKDDEKSELRQQVNAVAEKVRQYENLINSKIQANKIKNIQNVIEARSSLFMFLGLIIEQTKSAIIKNQLKNLLFDLYSNLYSEEIMDFLKNNYNQKDLSKIELENMLRSKQIFKIFSLEDKSIETHNSNATKLEPDYV